MKDHGLGHIYLRGNTYWIKYHKDGKPFYESSGSQFKSVATDLLKTRIAAPTVVKSRVLIKELLDDLVVYYQGHNPKSAPWAERMARSLRPTWEKVRADKVTTTAINEYVTERKEAGLGPASINRELAILKHALNLGKDAMPPKVLLVPKFKMLKEPAPRDGFLDHDQYLKLLEALQEELRVPFVIGYHTGSRKEEVLSIRLEQVRLKENKIQLRPGTTKNDEGRWLPIYGEMIDAIAKQVEETKQKYPECPWLSHRKGERIVDLRPAWPDACDAVGLDGLLFHDLRRSAVRNMVRAGIPEKVAMKISGHKTRAIFDRYNIVDNRDIEDAGKKLAEFLKKADKDKE
jgi:integrase